MKQALHDMRQLTNKANRREETGGGRGGTGVPGEKLKQESNNGLTFNHSSSTIPPPPSTKELTARAQNKQIIWVKGDYLLIILVKIHSEVFLSEDDKTPENHTLEDYAGTHKKQA